MDKAHVVEIDPQAFHRNPYPVLAQLRRDHPVAYVPQLGAYLISRREDIFVNEKKIDIFSSYQPDGLMSKLMGENMMRKDGEAHRAERDAIFPAVSPTTVKEVWKSGFENITRAVLDDLENRDGADLVADYALRVSAEGLKLVTGLTNMTYQEMDRTSQGMIDGCANYAGDAEVEANCIDCVESIDRHIDERVQALRDQPDCSLLAVQMQAGLSLQQAKANIRLAISGGQNEPRDAIAGTAWALITHPEQLAKIQTGSEKWMKAFEEYARWQSPIGMSPRRIAQAIELHGVQMSVDERVFLMFASANRDESVFDQPELFDLSRDVRKAISFGAGPHFCAGAWVSRAMVADVALPMLFERFPKIRLDGDVEVAGWAFRGPLKVPVRWD